MTIRVVTDSTADLTAGLAAKHRIEVVPLMVLFGDEQLRDGVDINSTEFFERLERGPDQPTTSQPSPAAFQDAYQRLIDEGATEILSIHVSAKLSGTLASARTGAEGLSARIVHIDSGMASLALGIGVIRATEAIDGGASLDETAAAAADQFKRTHVFIVLDTLEYLRRGGRIGRASHLIGTILGVKPVLSFEDGEVVPLVRARTQSKAIAEGLKRAMDCLPIEYAGAMHTTSPESMDRIVERLDELSPGVPMITGQMGPTIGVHAGPGTVAFAVISSPSSEG